MANSIERDRDLGTWTYRIEQLEEQCDKIEGKLSMAVYLLVANLAAIIAVLVEKYLGGK